MVIEKRFHKLLLTWRQRCWCSTHIHWHRCNDDCSVVTLLRHRCILRNGQWLDFERFRVRTSQTVYAEDDSINRFLIRYGCDHCWLHSNPSQAIHDAGVAGDFGDEWDASQLNTTAGGPGCIIRNLTKQKPQQ